MELQQGRPHDAAGREAREVRTYDYLDKLGNHLEKMQASLSDMRIRQNEIKAELSRKENYADKIEEIKSQLEKLDKKLGVNKK